MGSFTERFKSEQPKPPPPPPPVPWWASVRLWMILGALCGPVVYFAVVRKALPPALAKRLPPTDNLGRELKQATKDFVDKYAPAQPKDDGLPQGPAADKLSAPVDPTRSQGKYVGQEGPRSRSLLVKKRAREHDYASAAKAEFLVHHMNTPLQYEEFEVPFWQTDIGRGVATCGSLFIGFTVFGYILFRFRSANERTF